MSLLRKIVDVMTPGLPLAAFAFGVLACGGGAPGDAGGSQAAGSGGGQASGGHGASGGGGQGEASGAGGAGDNAGHSGVGGGSGQAGSGAAGQEAGASGAAGHGGSTAGGAGHAGSGGMAGAATGTGGTAGHGEGGAATGTGGAGGGAAGGSGAASGSAVIGAPALPPLPPGTGSGTTYYVSPSGHDGDDGKSAATAWQSLGKVAGATFQPGDSLLFEGGQSFAGCVTLSGSRVQTTADAPLTVSSYGSGPFTLTSTCSGNQAAALTLASVPGLLLERCVISGGGSGAAYGVLINGKSDSIRIQGCDISGFSATGSSYGGEIFEDGTGGGLSNLSILNNTLHGASGLTSPDDNGIVGFGTITTVLYQGNVVYDIGGHVGAPDGTSGNGMIANGVTGGLLQYNVAHHNGGNTTSCGGPGGIWAYSASHVIIQYNEVYATAPAAASAGCDWNAYDLDGTVTDSTMQYNYSHDNAGAGYLAYVTGPWSGNVIRYNVSENDGVGVGLNGYSSSTSDLAVYNNVVISKGAGQAGLQVAVPNAGSLGGHVANNLFCALGGGPLVATISWNQADVSGLRFTGNDYFAPAGFSIPWNGTTYAGLPAWASATGEETASGAIVGLAVDPKLAAPGTGGIVGGYLPSALSGDLPQPGSPVLGVGIDLKATLGFDVGSQDFYGNALPSGHGTGYNVGAYGGP